MKYDIERFCNDVETSLKNNLNTIIDSINTEKGDYNIAHVDADAYIFQSLDDQIVNKSPTIFYYIDEISGEGIGPATSEEISLDVVVILSDEKDGRRTQKLLRYLRALKELFNNQFNAVHSNYRVKVESLVPISFALQNSSHYADCIGVKITTTIA